LFHIFENTPYNNTVMTIQNWAELSVSLLTIVAVIAGSIKWLVKHYLSELKPNSGSSMKDQISRLESRINEADFRRKDMENKLDHMYDILIEYIAKSK
jgi:flagellar capping protein FliD